MKGIAGTGSLSVPYAFAKVCDLSIKISIGWYYPRNLFIFLGLLHDGLRNLSINRYSQQYGKP